jgi:hypothetical protein
LRGFAADGDSLLDHHRRFDRAQRVSLDGVRRVGQLDIVVMFEIGECLPRDGPQFVEPLLFGGDGG